MVSDENQCKSDPMDKWKKLDNILLGILGDQTMAANWWGIHNPAFSDRMPFYVSYREVYEYLTGKTYNE